MFERNVVATLEQGAVAVEVTLDDGSVTAGKMIMPAARSVYEVLNGPSAFVEFEPYGGERRYVAKSGLKAVKLLAGAQPPNLAQKLRDLDGFDPHSVLGVKQGAEWDDVRAAYLGRTKSYHPDVYANADLPSEVSGYLSGMLRRINAAYAALEVAHNARKLATDRRQSAVYTSSRRA